MASQPISEYTRWRPAPPLRSYLAWYGGYREAGVAPARHRGLPSPYLTVILTLHEPLVMAGRLDPRTPPGPYDALVGGLHTTPALITHEGRQSGIQLAISPLGARALLGLPAGELAGTDVDAADVLGPLADELLDRVREAHGWAERFAVLDRVLSRRAADAERPRPEMARAWRRLTGATGWTRPVDVAQVAREVGWSSRYLSRRFEVDVGLSPKAAARVARFDRARRLLQSRAAGTGKLALAELAARCGYYDQAHLAREFNALAGCSPSRWIREEMSDVVFRNVQAGSEAALPDSAA